VDKIVELLRQEDRPVVQQAVAELDSSTLKTFVTLLLTEEEKQVEKKKDQAKKDAKTAGPDNQCRP
jgi:hypothetical protein